MIDLRSDTVTQPSAEMRKVMAAAEVGDDVYGEDPSINRLEERIAGMLGKEAAMYVPSGTMSNQIAVKLHTQPGDELICEENCHVYNLESGGIAFHSQVQVKAIRGSYGVMPKEEVLNAIRMENIHYPRTALLSVENTHNRAGGTIYPLEAITELATIARDHKITMHLDGARLFNASIATGIPAADYAAPFDTISICFSKGLGAPVGSALVGSEALIRRARKYRKIFGGAMRQAGILAAACLYALEHNIERLREDHEKARRLAKGLRTLPGIDVNARQLQTNIIMILVDRPDMTAFDLAEKLYESGLATLAVDQQRIRAVTHLDVDMEDILRAIDICSNVVAG